MVVSFEPVGEGRTRITVVGLGDTEDPKSQELRGFFTTAYVHLLTGLRRVLQERP